jgi:hypothetical protein
MNRSRWMARSPSDHQDADPDVMAGKAPEEGPVAWTI